MINKETILSNYNDRLTLLQWLKKVELALQNASAKEFRVNQLGNATLTFSIVFDDDTELTTGPIVLQQGESVASGAIVGGHLYLTLTNGDVLDCGELFNGNVTINGDLSVAGDMTATGDIEATGALKGASAAITGSVEADTLEQASPNHSDSITPYIGAGLTIENIFNRVEVVNGVLYLVFNYKVSNNTGSSVTIYSLGTIYANIPNKYAVKIIDWQGHSAADSDNNNTTITIFTGFVANADNQGYSYEIGCRVSNTATANQIIISPEYGDGITFADGETKYFTGRCFLALL